MHGPCRARCTHPWWICVLCLLWGCVMLCGQCLCGNGADACLGQPYGPWCLCVPCWHVVCICHQGAQCQLCFWGSTDMGSLQMLGRDSGVHVGASKPLKWLHNWPHYLRNIVTSQEIQGSLHPDALGCWYMRETAPAPSGATLVHRLVCLMPQVLS